MNYEEMGITALCEAILKMQRPDVFNCDFIIQHINGDMVTAFHNQDGYPNGYAAHFHAGWSCVGEIVEECWDYLMAEDSHYHSHTVWDAYCIEHGVTKIRAAMVCFLKMKDTENE